MKIKNSILPALTLGGAAIVILYITKIIPSEWIGCFASGWLAMVCHLVARNCDNEIENIKKRPFRRNAASDIMLLSIAWSASFIFSLFLGFSFLIILLDQLI
jgi:hypothetical protein